MSTQADVLILGAGAAGLFCAAHVAQKGKRVVVLEKNERPGNKILISGGGRCNFTNRQVSSQHFHSANPHFCKSALARYSPADFIRIVEAYGITYHEKHQGQLFCDGSSKEILAMLLDECAKAGVEIVCNTNIEKIEMNGDSFRVHCADTRQWQAPRLVVATGGISYARLGATDLGLQLAHQFGHTIIEPRPALVPLEWSKADLEIYGSLAGVSCPVRISCGKKSYSDDLLFTHTGISGPAVLQISTHWRPREKIVVDFLPGQDPLSDWLIRKSRGERVLVKNSMWQVLPVRIADILCAESGMTRPLNETPDKDLRLFAEKLHHWEFCPEQTASYEKAEAMAGGVNTMEISSQTMESKIAPGLYFIGEVLDVTGDLGGYNFQWAWASTHAASLALLR